MTLSAPRIAVPAPPPIRIRFRASVWALPSCPISLGLPRRPPAWARAAATAGGGEVAAPTPGGHAMTRRDTGPAE